MNNNKHKNYEILNLLGYGLAKFNTTFIKLFGFKTKIDFYRSMVSYDVAETESVIKNRQDLFDPFFDNNRKGWWQKGNAYIHRKYLIDSLFGNLDAPSYVKIVQLYLQKEFNYDNVILENIAPIIKSKFKQLQQTGLEAEIYFLKNYQNKSIFKNGNIQDTRLFGDGYDFQIEVKNKFFLAEVKGVRSKKGAIRLTNKEYIRASEYKDKYILSIVTNLNDIPKITLISDPIKELKFEKNIFDTKQITFNTKTIIW